MFIDEESLITVEPISRGRSTMGTCVKWETFRLGVIPRLGFTLEAGQVAVTPKFSVRAGDICALTMGPHPEMIATGARFVVRWRRDGGAESSKGAESILFSGTMPEVAREEPWATWQFPIDEVGGTTGSILINISREFWSHRAPNKLALYDITVSDAATLQLEQARSFRALRIRNEQANFDAYYQHAMFQQTVDNQKNDSSDEQDLATGDMAPPPVAMDTRQAPDSPPPQGPQLRSIRAPG